MGRGPGTLSDKKRTAILRAAAEVFRDEGFQAASMDRIAERAEVSKRTVYNHFESKDALFDVVVQDLWLRLVPADDASLHAAKPLRARLVTLAHQRLDTLLAPELIALVRAVLAESVGASPSLGRVFRHVGQELQSLGFREVLRQEALRGRLHIEDIDLAASQFWGLVFEGLFWPAVLGIRATASTAERALIVDEGVTTFLARYAAPAPAASTHAASTSSASAPERAASTATTRKQPTATPKRARRAAPGKPRSE